MTTGEESIQLSDGEELVVIDRVDWLAKSPGRDPRETSLDLRRQASACVEVHPYHHASSATSTT